VTVSHDAAPHPIQFGPLIAVIGMISAFGLAMGFTYPALSLNMAERGVSEWVIGMHGAMAGLGLMVGAPLIPWLTTKVSPRLIAWVSFASSILSILGFGLTDSLVAWFALRFLLGMSVTTLFVVSETWLNELAPDHVRGRIVAIYTSSVAGTFGLGPLLIPTIGHSGSTPYFIVGGILAVLSLSLFAMRGVSGKGLPLLDQSVLRTSKGLLLTFPVVFLAVLSFGVLDGTILPLWAVYALERGADEIRATQMLTALIVGNVFFQIPIGWLADRYSPRVMMMICAGSCAAGAIALPFFSLSSPWIWPFLMIWGSLSFGVYTIAMMTIGHHLRGTRLVAANAIFSLLWGAGTWIGSATSGGLMDALGSIGLPIAIAFMFGLLTISAIILPIVRSAAAARAP